MTEHDATNEGIVFHVKRFLNENAPLVCALVISALILAACDGDGLTEVDESQNYALASFVRGLIVYRS